MKKTIHLLLSTAALGAITPAFAAEAKSDETGLNPKARKEIRVITSTDAERGASGIGPRQMMRHIAPAELESVTFLGIETSPVTPTLVAQLSLTDGAGLVVNQVSPKSPAASALQAHDILLKLDDQILIEQRQLAVLVRNRKEGDEVTLTFLRAGKPATARVKLAKHDAPKLSLMFEPASPSGMPERMAGGGGVGFEYQGSTPNVWRNREDVNRVLAMIDAARGPGQHRVELFRSPGPGDRNVSVMVNPGNSRIISDDERGSLELTINQGKKELVAKNTKGEPIFAGPVNTPEERKALPDEVRTRLEKLEEMKQFSFRTDADFQDAETKIVRPRGQGISLPRTEAPAMSGPRATLFF